MADCAHLGCGSLDVHHHVCSSCVCPLVSEGRSWLASPDEYRHCTSKSIPERVLSSYTWSVVVRQRIQILRQSTELFRQFLGIFSRENGARILKSVSRRFHRHWIHARTSDHGGKSIDCTDLFPGRQSQFSCASGTCTSSFCGALR